MIEFVEDSFEYIEQEPGIEGAYKIAELAARTCYKTENLIKDGSASRIIDNICLKNGHTSVVEFATIYLKVPVYRIDVIKKYFFRDKYTRIAFHGVYAYITTTLRTILQGWYVDPKESIVNQYDKNWTGDLKFMLDSPSKHHHRRYCYKFVMDRVGGESVGRTRGTAVAPGVSRAQESTRYCCYGSNKFGNTIRICVPSKFYSLVDEMSADHPELNEMSLDEKLSFMYKNCESWKRYVSSLKMSAKKYLSLIDDGWKAEDARGVLPLDLKTEFMMCTWKETWKFMLYRRTDKTAHPHIQKISKELEMDMKERGII